MSTLPDDLLTRTALRVYTCSLVGETLQGYAPRGVPLPWIAQCATVGFVALLLLEARPVRVPGLTALALLLAWGAVVSLANSIGGEYAPLMPYYGTTPYPLFIALRLVSLAAVGAQIYLVYWLLSRGGVEVVVNRTLVVAAAVAGYAIYVYVAQQYGLPVPPKTRLGTSGAEQAGVYTYAFHRAVGTFQEPGDLASWLVLPFFLNFFRRDRVVSVRAALIGSALFLTGSLAAIVGSMAGFVVAMVLVWPFRYFNLTRVAQAGVAVGLAALLFKYVAVANDGGSTDLLGVLVDRLRPILSDGIEVSNRDYIYEYVAQTPFPLLGVGLGNANLLLTLTLGSAVTVSFLSVYFATLYATGYVGLALLLAFLLAPLRSVVSFRLSQTPTHASSLVALTAVFVAYVVMMGFRAEEIPMSFGTVYGMLAFVSRRQDDTPQGMAACDF
ncbi:MAG: hypothetical protein WD845_10870 [Pirellulales bacterium]